MADDGFKRKFISTISVDEDDVANIELMKKLYNIPTRSAAIREAVKICIEKKRSDAAEGLYRMDELD